MAALPGRPPPWRPGSSRAGRWQLCGSPEPCTLTTSALVADLRKDRSLRNGKLPMVVSCWTKVASGPRPHTGTRPGWPHPAGTVRRGLAQPSSSLSCASWCAAHWPSGAPPGAGTALWTPTPWGCSPDKRNSWNLASGGLAAETRPNTSPWEPADPFTCLDSHWPEGGRRPRAMPGLAWPGPLLPGAAPCGRPAGQVRRSL